MANVETELLVDPILSWREVDLGSIKGKNKIEFDFVLYAVMTGDATGGFVRAYKDFYDINKEVYYCITDILLWSDIDAGDVNVYMTNTMMENTNFGASHDINLLTIQASADAASGYLSRDKLGSDMMYLGRPNSGTGELSVKFPTNTDAKLYNVMIMGFALKYALPLRQIFRKRIF